jgi:hypothetical protein
MRFGSFSRNGKDFTQQFLSIANAVAALPTTHTVIDGEIVACDEREGRISIRYCYAAPPTSAAGAYVAGVGCGWIKVKDARVPRGEQRAV